MRAGEDHLKVGFHTCTKVLQKQQQYTVTGKQNLNKLLRKVVKQHVVSI